jgi:hypothetical protein
VRLARAGDQGGGLVAIGEVGDEREGLTSELRRTLVNPVRSRGDRDPRAEPGDHPGAREADSLRAPAPRDERVARREVERLRRHRAWRSYPEPPLAKPT